MHWSVIHFEIRINKHGKIIDLFHNTYSPSGKQPEHRKLAHEL